MTLDLEVDVPARCFFAKVTRSDVVGFASDKRWRKRVGEYDIPTLNLVWELLDLFLNEKALQSFAFPFPVFDGLFTPMNHRTNPPKP